MKTTSPREENEARAGFGQLNPSQLLIVAQEQHRMGNSILALKTLEKAIFTPGRFPMICFFKACLQMALRQWSCALAQLNGLLAEGPACKALLLAKLECLISLGRQAEAVALLQAHRPTVRGEALLPVLEARLSLLQGQPEPVFQALDRALQTDSQKAAAAVFRAPELLPFALCAFRRLPEETALA